MNGVHRTGFALMAAAAVLASGCGEFAYKTGAGADALQADQQACKQAGGTPAAYKACMAGKGWSITNLDGESATYIPPQPQVAEAAAPASMPAGAPAPMAPAPMAPAETPWMKPTATALNPVPQAAPAAPAIDPMKRVAVTAWVKFGGGDPKESLDACVDTLGPAHKPDAANKTVTVALLSCMRDHGWRGL